MKLGLLILLLAPAATASAQLAPPPRPDCAAAEHRQLDFWLGEWDVFDAALSTVPIATSRIARIANGCGIVERYESPAAPGGPYAGTSYSAFDRKDGHWHQMYVDTNGNVNWYSGGLADGEMVLTAPARQGSLQRMVYRPHDDGSVEQVGTISNDGGRNWQPGYDYLYRRRR
ncbi:MAG: hypothetical protein JO276_11885 [Sphingomonadaceae bacterium]|nr:hypothetical protein [Sphingomonadaceae bacterium]